MKTVCNISETPKTDELARNRQIDEQRHLIRQFLAGDATAFDQLVESGKREAFARAYWLTGNRDDALDIVQDAYLKLLKALPRWDYSCMVGTWLHRVITNACIDLHRRRRTRLLVEEEDVAQAAGHVHSGIAPNPLRMVIEKEQMAALRETVESLPTRMRHCIQLRYFEGKSIIEIANLQACAVGTVKATVFQGLRKLRAALTLAHDRQDSYTFTSRE